MKNGVVGNGCCRVRGLLGQAILYANIACDIERVS